MPPLPQATAAALADRARQLLRDAAELTSGRDPNYIRDAQPESVFEALPLAAARQGCRRYADNPGGYSGRRQARVERACRPYLDSLEYGEGPKIKLPFRGGQCEQVNYTVTIRSVNYPFSDCSNFGPAITSNGFTGPIRGLRFGVENPSGELCTPGRNVAYLVHGPVGNETRVAGAGYGVEASIVSIVPENPQSPDCGNPDPDIEDPTPPPVPGPRREPFIRVPDIDIDIEVEVNPDLTIDVDFGTGPINIDPFGDEPAGGGGSGGPGEPGAPVGTGQGGDAEGEAPPGQILTGLRIDFVEPPIGGKEYAPGVYRGVCYIYMGTEDGLDHDPAGAMLRSGQFVYAEKDYLTRWVVTANMGYNLRVTPYYRPAEAEE